MEYKKTIILLALVVFLLSIAGVSASEIDNTIASENANTIELSTDNDIGDNLQTSEENMVFTSTDYDEAIAQTDTEVLGEGSATYSDLAAEISQPGNINLTHKNYTYDKGKTITISEDNKVIDGNGAVIDMNGSTIRAFHVNASGVTIKNLTIKNSYGGAIRFSGSGNVSNCNFVNNSASSNGGAVFFNREGTVTNCNFTDNTAYDGGAVYFYQGTGSVTNCNFTGNNATRDGGAVYFYQGTGSVTNCNFTDNNATRDGGAVYFYQGTGSVTNCNFTNNTATYYGGAINMGSGTVSNCNFTGNTAIDDGGAVYFYSTGNVTNCNFTNNTASRDGGAVYFWGQGTVSNCNFTNNTATYYGGAVYFYQGTGSVTNCNFTNNKATGADSWGGAIRMSSGTVTNCNFTNNTADYGGAIMMNSGSVENCNFTDNSASNGGAVYFNDEGTVTNCNFTDNTANYGGSVFFNLKGTVSNCNFTDNGAYYGGAVLFNTNGEVTNCNFTGNTASELGGAVYFYRTGTVSNCNFTGNTASINGGAVYFDEETGTVSNCNFTGNTASGDGGAIYFTQDATGNVINCNFTNNSAMGGGAVYFNSTGEVICCNFVNNRVEILEDCEGGGGALRFSKDGTIINCNFINNVAVESWGAAVYFDGHDATGTIITCNFTNNAATVDGGAISFNNHNIAGNVRSCNFANNTGRWGGAIDAEGICNVSSCNFSYNKALDGSGGAIYFNLKGEVTDCNFIGNSVWGKNNDGGAIQIYSGKVTRCNFTDNSASSDGGAISFSLNTEVTNCNFANNKAISGEGGAIYIWDTYETGSTIENCSFINNQATSGHGGAIYFRKFCNVENCNFTDNTASNNGGAVYFNSNGEVTNCNFTGNNATTGSAIYFYKRDSSDTLTVSDSTFLNNRANAGALDVVKNDNNITITFTGQNNLLNAIYSRNDAEVTFNNVKYWGANGITTISATMSGSNKEEGQNITVKGVVNGKIIDKINGTDENGEIVLDDAGDYLIIVSHKGDLYYTEIAETLFTNMKLYANVTSLTTNNKTVNITAKSNIPQDVVQGKLLFILPNGTQIEAAYGANGTWWAEHTFDAYGEYKVNATYVGLDNVTVNNGTITINKVNSTITLDNIVLDYGETKNVTVTTTGATGITAKIDGNNVTVINNYTIQIPVLDAGTYTLTVTTIPDDDYNPVTKEVNITVNKVNSTLTVGDMVFDYGSSGSIIVSVTGADGVNANVVGQPKAVVKVNGTNITVSDLDAGTYILTVTAVGDKNHNNVTKNATITVNKLKTELIGNVITTAYNVNKDLVITLKDSTGKALSGVKVSVDLNGAKTYTTDKNGQVKVSTKGLAPKTYTAKVTFNGNTNYDKSTKDIKVTVKKATPKLTAKKKTYKTTPKTKKYTIVLKDNIGKAIKKAKVTLKVKGKTYKATTNSKGKATFKITKLNKKGTFKATVTYKGNKYYNKISKKANIKIIVTFKTVSKGSKDKATVKEIQQALKDKGYYLTYQGHYLKVDGKFKGCTERSLKEFQKDNGLKVTGKVDEKTARKLGIL